MYIPVLPCTWMVAFICYVDELDLFMNLKMEKCALILGKQK